MRIILLVELFIYLKNADFDLCSSKVWSKHWIVKVGYGNLYFDI